MHVGHFNAPLLRWIVKVLRVGVEDYGLKTESGFGRRQLFDRMHAERFPKLIMDVVQRVVEGAHCAIRKHARPRGAPTLNAQILVLLAAENTPIDNGPALITTMTHLEDSTP